MRLLATTPFILLGALPAVAEPPRAEECLTDWGVAGEIVRHDKLLTVEEVSRSLAEDGVGQLVKTTLCRSPDGYIYRLVIRLPSGRLMTTTMSAKGR